MKALFLALFCVFLPVVAAAEEARATVSLTVPDTAWVLLIRSVHQVKEEVWVLAAVERDPEMMGAMMITTLETPISADLPQLPVRIFVVGKTWIWENEEEVTFLPSEEAFLSKLVKATRIELTD